MAYPAKFKSVRFGGKFINITEVARKAKIDPGYLSGVLSGRRNPSVKKLQHIAETLKMTTDQLLSAVAERATSDEPLRRKISA